MLLYNNHHFVHILNYASFSSRIQIWRLKQRTLLINVPPDVATLCLPINPVCSGSHTVFISTGLPQVLHQGWDGHWRAGGGFLGHNKILSASLFKKKWFLGWVLFWQNLPNDRITFSHSGSFPNRKRWKWCASCQNAATTWWTWVGSKALRWGWT